MEINDDKVVITEEPKKTELKKDRIKKNKKPETISEACAASCGWIECCFNDKVADQICTFDCAKYQQSLGKSMQFDISKLF